MCLHYSECIFTTVNVSTLQWMYLHLWECVHYREFLFTTGNVYIFLQMCIHLCKCGGCIIMNMSTPLQISPQHWICMPLWVCLYQCEFVYTNVNVPTPLWMHSVCASVYVDTNESLHHCDCVYTTECVVTTENICTSVNVYTTMNMSLCLQEEYNECISQPCLHKGVCVDKVNDYHCNCTEGWTGKRCETIIHYCSPDLCMHGATCHEVFKDYFCQWVVYHIFIQGVLVLCTSIHALWISLRYTFLV